MAPHPIGTDRPGPDRRRGFAAPELVGVGFLSHPRAAAPPGASVRCAARTQSPEARDDQAGELYKAGRLGEAIEAQVQEVKASPLDQAKRLFLFELAGFAGDLDRARRQIDVRRVQGQRPRRRPWPSTASCWTPSRPAAICSPGDVAPGFFGEPSEHLRLRLEAVNRLREGRPGGGRRDCSPGPRGDPRSRASSTASRSRTFRDADDLFGGVLEVMAHGRYFWVGLEQVRLVAMNPPRFPRDLLFIPAHLELATSGRGLPARALSRARTSMPTTRSSSGA